MKAVCCVYDTDFRQLTESQEMATRKILFGNVDLVPTDPLLNVWRKALK